jgi:hypothetical protein
MKTMGRLAFLLTIGIGACRGTDPTGLAAASSCENGFFLPAVDSAESLAELQSDPSVVRSRLVTPDFPALTRDEALELNLFDDVCLRAVRESLVMKSPTSLVWSGHIENQGETHVILVREQGALVGSITLSGRLYQVRVLSSGTHALVEVDPSALPPEAEPPSPPPTSSVPR